MKCTRLLFTLLLSVAISCGFAIAKSAYEDGVAAYNARDYQTAIKLLLAATMADHANDATAHYYLANAMYAAHMVNGAKQEYATAMRLQPTGPLADYCRRALTMMGSAAATAASSPPALRMSVTERHDSDLAIPPSDQAANIDDMVSTVKPIDMHPDLTADFTGAVKDALSHMPTAMLKTLRANSCKIIVTPTMIDHDPSLKNERPRGYHAGGSYKNCPALFDGEAVVVSEYYFDDNKGRWLRNPQPVESLKHEVGHAMDQYLGRISQGPQFVQNYKSDFAKLSDSDKRDLYYYCYNEGAHSETFAELTSALLGAHDADQLARCFPNTTQQVKSALLSARR